MLRCPEIEKGAAQNFVIRTSDRYDDFALLIFIIPYWFALNEAMEISTQA